MQNTYGNKSGAIILEGHVQGLSNLRSLGQLGIPVFVVDQTRCLAQYSRFCTKAFRCPPFQSDGFVPYLIRLAKEEGIKDWVLVPSNDHIVEQMSRHRDELGQYYRMAVPDTETLDNIVDKWKLSQIASELCVPTPRTCCSDNIDMANHFHYPVLIKGRRGLSFYKHFHRKAIVVHSPAELQTLLSSADYSDYIVQEQLENTGNRVFSFTCFSLNGVVKTHWTGIKLREHPPLHGTATLAQSMPNPGLLPLGKLLMRRLNYTGVCEIEFMLDERDGQYKLIEINPRTWLWVGLAKACGVDYAKMLYRYLLNEEQSFANNHITHLKWINTTTDFPYALSSIMKGKLSIPDYFKSLCGKKVHAILDIHDPLPALMLPFLAATIIKRRK